MSSKACSSNYSSMDFQRPPPLNLKRCNTVMRPTRLNGESIESTSPMPHSYSGVQSPKESDDKSPVVKRPSNKKISWKQEK